MLVFFLYLGLTTLFAPVILAFSLFNQKLRTRLLTAYSHNRAFIKSVNKNRGDKPLLLLHAASAGEFEQLVPILTQLNRNQILVILSVMSPTIFNKQYDTDLADAVIYHPLDFWWLAMSFFYRLNPMVYVLNRHDIWPAHLMLSKAFGVKVILLNANLHEKSKRLKPVSKKFNQFLFSRFDKVCTGSERLGDRLAMLISKDKIQITGDTRFNRVQERKDSHALRKEFVAFRSSKNVILGSIIPSDYHVVFGGLKKIFPSGQGDLEQENVRLIVVPHEPVESEISEIIRILDDWKIDWSKLSVFGEDETPSALIVDEVGLLADIYSIGRCAYVGAGFGAGVHSVIEPAVHGCPVSFGPNIHILDEAIDLHELGLGTIVTSEQGFSHFLSIIYDDEKFNETADQLKAFVKNRSCDIQKIINTITP